jgi:hypothetical protein
MILGSKYVLYDYPPKQVAQPGLLNLAQSVSLANPELQNHHMAVRFRGAKKGPDKRPDLSISFEIAFSDQSKDFDAVVVSL